MITLFEVSQSKARFDAETQKGKTQKKEDQSGNAMFFQCFVAPEGGKVGSLKRRVRSHLGR